MVAVGGGDGGGGGALRITVWWFNLVLNEVWCIMFRHKSKSTGGRKMREMLIYRSNIFQQRQRPKGPVNSQTYNMLDSSLGVSHWS